MQWNLNSKPYSIGNSISAYGTIDLSSGGVQSSYSVDGAPASTVTSRATPDDTYDQLFWQSPTLPMGNQYVF